MLVTRVSQTMSLISLFVICCVVTSCIPIDDLGVYWDKGVVDRRLEGHWKKAGVQHRSQDQYVSFKLDGKSYLCTMHEVEERPEPQGMPHIPKPTTEARTLQGGKHRFLMLRTEMPEMPSFPTSGPAETRPATRAKPQMMSGLLRYEFDGEQLVSYTLQEQVLAAAIKGKTIDGQIPGENDYSPPSIRKLDQKTLDEINRWADNPKNWKEIGRYNRIPDIDKALVESRTYPASLQTAAKTTVDVNLPDLKYLAEDKGRVLLRQLEASPEWEVVDEGGEIVCYREGRSNGYESNWDSSPSQEERYQVRYLFRFSNKPGGGAHWGSRLKTVTPLEGKTQLNLMSSDQGIESYLTVGQKGLWFEFFEQTQVEERRHTRRALEWVKRLLADVRSAEADIQMLGYAPKLTPKGAVRKGTPSIEIIDTSVGFYEVRAWINPGAHGRAYMKLYDRNSGAPLPVQSASDFRAPLFVGSKRRVAWSADPETLFSYKETIFGKSESDQTFDARVELWFKQEGADKESKLGETTHTFVTSKPMPH